jgi:hypothetical protein
MLPVIAITLLATSCCKDDKNPCPTPPPCGTETGGSDSTSTITLVTTVAQLPTA